MMPSTTNNPTPCTVVSLEAKADKVLPAARPPTKRKAILIPLLLLAFFGAATISMLVTIVVQNEATRATDVRGDALRSRETGHVLQTRSINMFSTLADLPCQSTSFISNLDHVLLVVDGVVRKYSIDNFALHNASSLVLYTTLRTGDAAPHSIVIKDRRAYVDYGDGTWGRISVDTDINVHQKRNLGTARRLADLIHTTAPPSRARGVVTWDELMREYEQHQDHRELSASGGNALYDLYRFFGGVAVASGSDDDGSAVEQASCGGPLVTAAAAPVPDLPLLSKWTTVGAFNGTWFMDLTTLEKPRFHLMSSVDGTFQHEVVSGDSKSTYWSWDPDFESGGRNFDPDFVRSMAAVKGGCSNDNFSLPSESTTATVEVDEIHPDGSATWRVGGWIVRVDSQGGVMAIGDIAVTSVVEYEASERAGGGAGIALYEACVEGEEDLVPFFEDVSVPTFNGTGADQPPGRKLGVATYLQSLVTATFWCGGGTNIATTTCPGYAAGRAEFGGRYDYTADRACRRHDHSGYVRKIGGLLPRINCNSDRDLARATNNGAVQSIYGNWGLAQTWGCYDYESYFCWKWKRQGWWGFWYPSSCKGVRVNYGPWRYNSISYSWSYSAKKKWCPNDMF